MNTLELKLEILKLNKQLKVAEKLEHMNSGDEFCIVIPHDYSDDAKKAAFDSVVKELFDRDYSFKHHSAMPLTFDTENLHSFSDIVIAVNPKSYPYLSCDHNFFVVDNNDQNCDKDAVFEYSEFSLSLINLAKK